MARTTRARDNAASAPGVLGVPTHRSVAEQKAALSRMTRRQRLAAYRRGELTYVQCCAWAAKWPREVPILHGEFEFIARTSADLD